MSLNVVFEFIFTAFTTFLSSTSVVFLDRMMFDVLLLVHPWFSFFFFQDISNSCIGYAQCCAMALINFPLCSQVQYGSIFSHFSQLSDIFFLQTNAVFTGKTHSRHSELLTV